MWHLLFALPLLVLSPGVQAQSSGIVDYSQLPQCAQQCAQLTNAQAACTSTPSQEKPCFCQSAYLTVQTNLFNTPDGTCASECPSADDRRKIQTWFIGYCRGGNTDSTATTSSSSSATSSSRPKGSSQGSNGSNEDENQSWWSGHAKWIAMVIVLIIAFVLIIFIGVWLKRRHDRKVNQGSTVPLPVGWGPNSDPHSYPGPNAEKRAAAGKSRAGHNSASLAEQGKTRKLQKFFGR